MGAGGDVLGAVGVSGVHNGDSEEDGVYSERGDDGSRGGLVFSDEALPVGGVV